MSASATRLRAVGRSLLDGFWLVPASVALAYSVLALLLVAVDRAAGPTGVSVGFDGDADASRDILSTLAASLITVAGVAFSLTIVVLVLVSSQFSPRALPGFLADRLNQVVAGSFVGIFAYCLIVLASVRERSAATQGFVPAASVMVAILLGLAALALLLVFIHHMGQSIQASEICARLGSQTLAAIDRLHPEPYARTGTDARTETARAWRADRPPQRAYPGRAGYVQGVPLEGLLASVARPGARLHVLVCPGDFVTEGTPVVDLWAPEPLDDTRLAALGRAIPVAAERHLAGDAAYGIRQLADVAVKALSPGINDPTTAATCIGHLRAILERLAGRALPPALEVDEDGSAVAVVRVRSWDEYVDGAYAEIGRYGTDNARIVLGVLDALDGIAAAATRAGARERRAVLGVLAQAVAVPALAAARTPRDEAAVAAALERVSRRVAER